MQRILLCEILTINETLLVELPCANGEFRLTWLLISVQCQFSTVNWETFPKLSAQLKLPKTPTYLHIIVGTHVCVCVCACICVRAHVCMCAYVCMTHICVFVCMCACICTYIAHRATHLSESLFMQRVNIGLRREVGQSNACRTSEDPNSDPKGLIVIPALGRQRQVGPRLLASLAYSWAPGQRQTLKDSKKRKQKSRMGGGEVGDLAQW